MSCGRGDVDVLGDDDNAAMPRTLLSILYLPSVAAEETLLWMTAAVLAPALCVRCKLLEPVIALREIAYCLYVIQALDRPLIAHEDVLRECFGTTFTTKFRKGLEPARERSRLGSDKDRALGKRRTRFQRSSAMMAFSGGASSRYASLPWTPLKVQA